MTWLAIAALAVGYLLGRAHATRRHSDRLREHFDYYGADLIDPRATDRERP